MLIRKQLEEVLGQAVEASIADGSLILEGVPDLSLERPRDDNNGDFASTLALRLAKQAHKNPREIAQIVINHLPVNDLIQSVAIAGPGFINFILKPSAYQQLISVVRSSKSSFGKGEAIAHPSQVNIEYVSANPTGPMHIGHGRWAALGDSMARVMRHAGYSVSEEFYVNDHGVQMDIFGTSISVRYQQLLGVDIELPENSYGGSYVKDIAQQIIDTDGAKWLEVSEEERKIAFREIGYNMMLENMKGTLQRFGTTFDCWFSERRLYVEDEKGQSPVSMALEAMDEKGYIYEAEGATWFQSTAFGDEKDRVLLKANGEYTYFMSDVAYHYNKINRGFDHLINIWGADHHGYVKRCEAMLEAWGYKDSLEVVLGQLVNLFRDGEAVRMSKRTGEMISFEELIDEVGVDATRYFMLSRSSDQPIDFDIEVAKKKDASNPVYYVQYAHARICSLINKVAEARGLSFAQNLDELDQLVLEVAPMDADISLLTHPTEIALLKKVGEFEDFIAQAARDRAPFRLTHYCQDLAALFHQFYTQCHVMGEDESLLQARLSLAETTRQVLKLSLSLLGISAPIKM